MDIYLHLLVVLFTMEYITTISSTSSQFLITIIIYLTQYNTTTVIIRIFITEYNNTTMMNYHHIIFRIYSSIIVSRTSI